MTQQAARPILIDFFALSCTGKSTHTQALFDHLAAEGYKVGIIGCELRNKKRSPKKLPRKSISALVKSLSIGRVLLRLSSRKSGMGDICRIMRWSYRLAGYGEQLKSNASKDFDFIIMDPSLSSKLKDLYRYFDEHSFVKVVSLLEENEFMSDIIVIIDADIEIVKKRRLGRGSPELTEGDAETFSIRKSFREAERQNSPTKFLTVPYDSFSSLGNNIRQIAGLCVHTRSQASSV